MNVYSHTKVAGKAKIYVNIVFPLCDWKKNVAFSTVFMGKNLPYMECNKCFKFCTGV